MDDDLRPRWARSWTWAISIASAVHEVYTTNRELGPRALFMAGMNVGRDMMGTMATTLILAFTGSTFMSLLVLYAYKVLITNS